MLTSIPLDIDQSRVVKYNGDTICIAGPGSGKTRVLTAKAETLVRAGQDVICLTFTRAAAQEIRDRIPGIPAGTIHSLCHSVVGWKDNHGDLLDRYIQAGHEKYDWVLVDEVQDLTPEQLEVVFSLVGKHLFGVGDPFQSIYGYGGAVGGDIVSLLTRKGCKSFTLYNNYRSIPFIVKELNYIYRRNLVSTGTDDNGITAILCRSNAAVHSAGDILKRRKVGYRIRFGSNEYGPKKEIFRGSNKIQISTVHASKGLEFRNVILFGWAWDPTNSKSYGVQDSWHLDENLNVYYVAVSRAAVGFIEVLTASELLGALEGMVPDLKSLRYRDDEIRVGHSSA